jgi:hypothetical protein
MIVRGFKILGRTDERRNREEDFSCNQGTCKRGDSIQLFTDMEAVKSVHRKFSIPGSGAFARHPQLLYREYTFVRAIRLSWNAYALNCRNKQNKEMTFLDTVCNVPMLWSLNQARVCLLWSPFPFMKGWKCRVSRPIGPYKRIQGSKGGEPPASITAKSSKTPAIGARKLRSLSITKRKTLATVTHAPSTWDRLRR